jgi:mono/diheme cytochrome c family protein
LKEPELPKPNCRPRQGRATARGFLAGIVLLLTAATGLAEAGANPLERGEYLARAAGCVGCHTLKSGSQPYAGGRAMKTPFGTYYSPNITPDPETGIGAWSAADFLAALRDGVRPDGAHLFPVFPYPSYTRMSEDDILAIRTYLMSLPPVRQENRPHDVPPPFGWRWTMAFWKLMFFEPGALPEGAAENAPEVARGRYLVDALGHCGECHTPRNRLGAPDGDMYLAGTPDGPDGELVPNITPDAATGIGDWSEGDIATLLRDGLKPNYDDVQGSMAEAIAHGLKYLTRDDLRAIAAYLKQVPAVSHKVVRKAP